MLVGFNDGTKTYLYTRNLQGDIVSIIDTATGNTVAQYTYDSWGNVLTATGVMAEVNPIRYRGYYYDSETELYYLQSRYYDAEVGRFLNADEQINSGLLGINVFIYCENNPVLYIDPSGCKGYIDLFNFRDIMGFMFEQAVIACMADPFSKEILSHWINGNGKTKYIYNNESWTNYLLGNQTLKKKLNAIILSAIRKKQKSFAQKTHISLTSHINGGVGGYRTGYELLNGSNSTVGDFYVAGDIISTKFNGMNCYLAKGYFIFNDIVDPNKKYANDIKLYNLMKNLMRRGKGNDYIIRIMCEFTIMQIGV